MMETYFLFWCLSYNFLQNIFLKQGVLNRKKTVFEYYKNFYNKLIFLLCVIL